mgnify:CR=1 FL=1
MTTEVPLPLCTVIRSPGAMGLYSRCSAGREKDHVLHLPVGVERAGEGPERHGILLPGVAVVGDYFQLGVCYARVPVEPVPVVPPADRELPAYPEDDFGHGDTQVVGIDPLDGHVVVVEGVAPYVEIARRIASQVDLVIEVGSSHSTRIDT